MRNNKARIINIFWIKSDGFLRVSCGKLNRLLNLVSCDSICSHDFSVTHILLFIFSSPPEKLPRIPVLFSHNETPTGLWLLFSPAATVCGWKLINQTLSAVQETKRKAGRVRVSRWAAVRISCAACRSPISLKSLTSVLWVLFRFYKGPFDCFKLFKSWQLKVQCLCEHTQRTQTWNPSTIKIENIIFSWWVGAPIIWY